MFELGVDGQLLAVIRFWFMVGSNGPLGAGTRTYDKNWYIFRLWDHAAVEYITATLAPDTSVVYSVSLGSRRFAT